MKVKLSFEIDAEDFDRILSHASSGIDESYGWRDSDEALQNDEEVLKRLIKILSKAKQKALQKAPNKK